MDSSAKPGDESRVLDAFTLVFFSLVTVGALPIVFWTIAHQRRRRVRRFFRNGLPAVAEIFRIEFEALPFDEKIARVSYQFEADGAMHRDSDQVLPMIANRWQTGDAVQVLYIAAQEYDSVIISTS